MYYRMWYTIIVPRKRPTPDGPTRASPDQPLG
nr:MAG TPA: hypothetical protein [Caudoviricetes sp.]